MNELLKRALEARARAVEAIREKVDAADAEKRDLSADENTFIANAEADVRAHDARIAELRSLVEGSAAADEARALFGAVARPAGAPAAAVADDATLMRSLFRGESRAHDFEKRAATAGVAAAGGSFIPTGFVNKLVEYAQFNSAWAQLGVTVLETSSGEPLTVPKKTSYTTAQLVGEGQPIDESTFSTGSAQLTAYASKHLSQYSYELAADSALDIVGLIARDHGLAHSNLQGGLMTVGTGSNQPQGIVTGANVGKTAESALAITFDDLIDLQHSVLPAYRQNAKWLIGDGTLAALRKVKDNYGRYILEPSATAGAPDMLLGKPFVVDPNVAAIAAGAKTVAFGDFSAAYIARLVSTIRVEASTEFAFASDLVTIKSVWRFDGKTVDANAVKTLVMAAS